LHLFLQNIINVYKTLNTIHSNYYAQIVRHKI